MTLRGLDGWLTREPDSCDPGRIRDEPEEDAFPLCDWCDVPILQGAISLGGVGVYCCRHHANLGTEQHALAMRQRRA